jgi:hypothetical protein
LAHSHAAAKLTVMAIKRLHPTLTNISIPHLHNNTILVLII